MVKFPTRKKYSSRTRYLTQIIMTLVGVKTSVGDLIKYIELDMRDHSGRHTDGKLIRVETIII